MKKNRKIVFTFLVVLVIGITAVLFIQINRRKKPIESAAELKEETASDTGAVQMEENTELLATDKIPLYQGEKDAKTLPESYMIDQTIRIDYQSGPKCGGYATALLLRYYGEEIKGTQVYADLAKMENQHVHPLAIKDYVDNYGGFECSIYVGTLDSIKEELSDGFPVIILGYVNEKEKGAENLHYLVVTGYDQDQFYLADSIPAGEITEHYNRTIDYDSLLELWDTAEDVELKQVFLTIHKKS